MRFYIPKSTLVKTASPKDKIAQFKISDPHLVLFISQYENYVSWGEINSAEDISNFISIRLIPSLYNLIDPELKEGTYYITDFPMILVEREYNGDDNHPANPEVVKIINSNQNKEEGFKQAQKFLLDEANKIKRLNFFGWWRAITEENQKAKNSPAFQYIILKKMFDSSNSTSRKELPVVNHSIIDKIFNSIIEKNGEAFNILNAYRNESLKDSSKLSSLLPGSTIENGNGWHGIPSEIHDPKNFQQNRILLNNYSEPNKWCTTLNGPGRRYLNEGDFWVYAENYNAKVGIKFYGDSISEITGPQYLPTERTLLAADYWEEIIELAERKGWNLAEMTKNGLISAQNSERLIRENKRFNDSYNTNKNPIETLDDYRKLSKENRLNIPSEQIVKIAAPILIQISIAPTIENLDEIMVMIPKELREHNHIQQAYIGKFIQIIPLKKIQTLSSNKKKVVFRAILKSQESQDRIAKTVTINNINDIPAEIANEILNNENCARNIENEINRDPSLIGTIDRRLLKRIPKKIIFDNPKVPLERTFSENPTFIFSLFHFIKSHPDIEKFCDLSKNGIVTKIKSNPEMLYNFKNQSEQNSIPFIFNKKNLDNVTKYLEQPELKKIILSDEIKEAFKEAFNNIPEEKIGAAWNVISGIGVKLDPEATSVKINGVLNKLGSHIPPNIINMINELNLWDNLNQSLIVQIARFPMNILSFPSSVVEKNKDYLKASLMVISKKLLALTPNDNDNAEMSERKNNEYCKFTESNKVEIKLIKEKFAPTYKRFSKAMDPYFNYGEVLSLIKNIKKGDVDSISTINVPEEYITTNWHAFSDDMFNAVMMSQNNRLVAMEFSDYPKFLREAVFKNQSTTFANIYKKKFIDTISNLTGDIAEAFSICSNCLKNPEKFALTSQEVNSLIVPILTKLFKSSLDQQEFITDLVYLWLITPPKLKEQNFTQLPMLLKLIPHLSSNLSKGNLKALISIALDFPELTKLIVKELSFSLARTIPEILSGMNIKSSYTIHYATEFLVDYAATEQGKEMLQSLCQNQHFKKYLNDNLHCDCFGSPIIEKQPITNQPQNNLLNPSEPPKENQETVTNPTEIPPATAPGTAQINQNKKPAPIPQNNNVEARSGIFNLKRCSKRNFKI